MTRPRLLASLAFLSGVGGVVYEVLYLRLLTPVLGDMYYVHAALLCVFLAGVGIGAKIAHRLSPYLYLCELLIGGYALLFPLILGAFASSPLYHLIESPAAHSLFSAALLLALPAIAVGVSVPVFSAYLDQHAQRAAPFPTTYFLYHLATVISVLAVELVLVRVLGLRASLAVIGAANVLCGIALWSQPRLTPESAQHAPARAPRSDVIALLLASLASALFQGFYLKLCYHLFRPQQENFAICTAVVLLGLALGALVVARRGMRFTTCVIAAAVAVAAASAAFGPLSAAYLLLHDHALPLLSALGVSAGVSGLIGLKLLFAALLGGAPMIFLGATIPALVGVDGAVAQRSGHLLFVSGLANAAGFLLYVFLVHPALPLYAVAPLSCGLLVAAFFVHRGVAMPGALASRPLMLSAVALVALLSFAVTRPERLVYLANVELSAGSEVTHLKAAADDVSYVEEPGRKWVTFNGHPSITIERGGRVNLAEVVGGVLPALVAPRTASALVLGLGTGFTAGTLAQLFDHVDVAEINGAFIELLPRLAFANFALHQNPRAQIYHQDARRLLASHPGGYDLIVNAAPIPTFFAAGKLYTREFFELARRSLVDDGVYVTWYAPGSLGRSGLDTMLATLGEVFADCRLATLQDSGYNFYIVMCAPDEVHPWTGAEVALPRPLRSALAHLTTGELSRLLRCSYISGNVLRARRLRGATINTDDLPVMEFQLSRLALPGLPRPGDFVAEDPQAFAVALPAAGGAAPEDLVAYLQLHRPLFERLLWPRIAGDAELREAFCETAQGQVPEAELMQWCSPSMGHHQE